jgi:hypothetical protein
MRRVSGYESLVTPRKGWIAELRRTIEVLITIMHLLASIDDKLVGICSVLAVPTDDPDDDGTVTPLRPVDR